MGVYIVHPKFENTRKPKILAHTRDKVVIHQNVVVWDQLHKNYRGSNFAVQEDFCFVLISVPNSIPKRRNYGRLAL